MSNYRSQSDPIVKVAQKIPALQDATSDVDNAVAGVLGINLTDLHCLAILLRNGPSAANELATALRLTPGAVTTVLDRLARAGLAERTTDPHDRRGVLVTITAFAKRRVQQLWGPIAKEGRSVLAGYSRGDLTLIEDFLDRARKLQLKHAERIRASRKVIAPGLKKKQELRPRSRGNSGGVR